MSDINFQKITSRIYSHFRAIPTDVSLVPLVSTDSRAFGLHDGGSGSTGGSFRTGVFFALSGERFDGNDFAEAALENGASLTVVAAVAPNSGVACPASWYDDSRFEVVDDVLTTLQGVARLHRAWLAERGVPVVGLTGTNGKTTTKELIVRVLVAKYNHVGATAGNYNNHIGVPLTILGFGDQADVCVVEMGANHEHEIAALCDIARPTVGLITNVGSAHLEGFGSIEGVRRAKGELYDFLLNAGGEVLYRSDDQVLSEMVSERFTSIPLQKVGLGDANVADFVDANSMVNASTDAPESEAYGYCAGELGVSHWRSNADGYLQFCFRGRTVVTAMVGVYNIYNVLAALAVGTYFGVPADLAVNAVAAYRPDNNRSQRIVGHQGNIIIMDAYNANPSSMKESISNFMDIESSLSKVVIVGDMRELGPRSSALHGDVVEQLALYLPGVSIYGVGQQMSAAFNAHEGVSGYASKNISERASLHAPQGQVHLFPDTASLIEFLKREPISESFVLVKGSRGVGLEGVEGVL